MSDGELFEPRPTGRHLTTEELHELSESSPAYQSVGDRAHEDLAQVYECIEVPGGAQLIAQGVPHGFHYWVVRGRLRAVRSDASGRPGMVADLRRGEDVGLEFMLKDSASLYDLFAVRDSLLLRLSRADFERVVPWHSDLLMTLARCLVEGAETVIRGYESRPAEIVNVAVVPESSHRRLEGVVANLVEEVAKLVSTAHLSARRAAEAVGDGSSERLLTWLDEQEHTHRLVLYECDAAPSAWNETALRMADRILLCASAGASPDPERVRSLLPKRMEGPAAQRVDLLLVHEPESGLGTQTAEWLEAGRFAHHYQVRLGNREDFARAARRLTGRAVGVVMGGGGARGIAHIGVLQALQEQGMPIDVVGGASMGSIFAAAWARGWSPEEMLERVREVFAPKRALVDLTFPVVALTVGAKLERVLRGLYEGLTIEDLWTPFFCTSTSLTRPGLVVHDRGGLWEAIRASVSLPAIFPPVQLGDDVLVDSAVVDNVPVTTMARFCDGGPVIAVDVADSSPLDFDPRYENKASGWALLARKLTPFASSPRFPAMIDLISRCVVVASEQKAAQSRERADLYLEPPVSAFGTLQFEAHDDIYRAGYEYAMQRLADWTPPTAESAKTFRRRRGEWSV